MPQRFTLGIEEEFQLVDPVTRELKSHIEEMMAAGAHLGDQIKPELHQSVVEVGTPVCADIHEARQAVTHLRRSLIEMAEDSRRAHRGRRHASRSATGRTSRSRTACATRTSSTRWRTWRGPTSSSACTFTWVSTATRCSIQVMNGVRAFLPHLLALSVNSPFWCGRKTGVKSVRSTIFKRFPRTQIPDFYYSWDDYAKYVDLLVRTNSIDDGREDLVGHPAPRVLQDARVPHLRHPLPGRGDDRHRRLVQALVAKLHGLFERNLGIRGYSRAILMENKFRALKRGLDGR